MGQFNQIDQPLLDPLVHSGHLRRAHRSYPKKTGNLANFSSGHPPKKHLLDDLLDTGVLPAIADNDCAVADSKLSVQKHLQAVNNTKTCFYGFLPLSMTVVPLVRGPRIRLLYDVSH